MIAPATRADRARAGRNGARSRRGRCVIWIDGRPYDKHELAKKHDLTVERINQRAYDLRRAGRPITLAAITAPLRRRKDV